MSLHHRPYLLLAATTATLLACETPDPLLGLPPPGKSNSFVAASYGSYRPTLDLLFVVDGSASMTNKRNLVRMSLSSMVRRLAFPDCIYANGESVPAARPCPEGTFYASTRVESINIGVISASLGGHGSSACPEDEEGRHNNDRAHLIPSVRPAAPDPNGTGILTWRGGSQEELDQLLDNLEAQVDAVGNDGCDYPAPLEAWYRFLADPSPPARILVDAFGYSRPAQGDDGNILLDHELLAQREAFLRPQSYLSIVVLSDKDDCSVMEGGPVYEGAGLGHWLLETAQPLPAPSSICQQNPNDRCCFSCLVPGNLPEGCDASECSPQRAVPPEEDPASLRCFDGRRRFGMDFLYPPERYIEALTQHSLVDSHTGEIVDNPIMMGVGENRGRERHPGMVFFAGVVGVPWQDVATWESLSDPSVMEYLWAEELLAIDPSIEANRWQLMLGEPGHPARSRHCLEVVEAGEEDPRCGAIPSPPIDPFMIESVAPRSSVLENPVSGDFIIDVNSINPRESRINGHEFFNPKADSFRAGASKLG